MEILTLAQTMELEGKAYYEQLAAETEIAALKGAFTFLAVQEQGHYELFKAMEQGQQSATIANDVTLGEKVKEFFSSLDASFALPEVIYDYQTAYGKALAMEKESIRMYTDLAAEVSADGKETVELIIAQEKGHVRLIESLIDFMGNTKSWLENAEWRNIDAY